VVRTLWLIVLVACGADGAGKDTSASGTETTPTGGATGSTTTGGTPAGTTPAGTTPTGTTPSGTGTTEPVFTARCDRSGLHPLVATCAVQLDPAGPVTATLEADGVATRVVSAVIDGDGAIVVPYLHADRSYSWRVEADGSPPALGELSTGSLPMRLEADLAIEGAPTMPRVLTTVPCDGVEAGPSYVVVVDTEPLGVTWFAELDGDDPMQARRTFDGTLAMVSFGSRVMEWSPDGAVLTDFVSPDPFLHHDLDIRDGRVAALWKETGLGPDGTRIDEGFAVFDRDGVVLGRFAMTDLIPPPEGAQDWLHSNGIEWLADGDVIVSLRHQSAVLRVAADPDSPDFGAVRWWLTGEPDQDLPSDFVVLGIDGGPDDFRMQHDAHLLADGSLLMFDNRGRTDRTPVSEPSRAVRLVLDPVAGEARVVESWPLERHCPFSGTARLADDGTLLVVCAPYWDVSAFAEGDVAPGWSMTVACGSGYTSGWTRRVMAP
jgi:hypothetical protein